MYSTKPSKRKLRGLFCVPIYINILHQIAFAKEFVAFSSLFFYITTTFLLSTEIEKTTQPLRLRGFYFFFSLMIPTGLEPATSTLSR